MEGVYVLIVCWFNNGDFFPDHCFVVEQFSRHACVETAQLFAERGAEVDCIHGGNGNRLDETGERVK
jgi:hypothetical protein